MREKLRVELEDGDRGFVLRVTNERSALKCGELCAEQVADLLAAGAPHLVLESIRRHHPEAMKGDGVAMVVLREVAPRLLKGSALVPVFEAILGGGRFEVRSGGVLHRFLCERLPSWSLVWRMVDYGE